MTDTTNRRLSPFQISLILACVIGCVAAVVYVATFDHARPSASKFCALAAAWTSVATIAPIWLESLIFNGATFQLAVITWRLTTMLGALLIAQTFAVEVRNCFVMTLMACYFIALPLESWLLARNAAKR